MTTTHHDNATAWRELADALSPQQVIYLEEWERHPEIPPMADGNARPGEAHQKGLLYAAREFVESNAAAALFADVAEPTGATFVDTWQQWDAGYSRVFDGTSRVLDEHMMVDINGVQFIDGRAERTVRICPRGKFNDGDMSAAQARRAAAALIEAADEMDRLK